MKARWAMVAFVVAVAGLAWGQTPLGSTFTYQGRLNESGVPLTDTPNIDFSLWDAEDGGAQIGTTLSLPNHPVTKGLFTAPLNFGADAFTGDARWLQIAVEGQTLTPRQPLTATPYALYALRAAEAGAVDWADLTGIPDGFLDGQDDDTTYTAGEGLVLAGTEFRANFGGTGNAPWVARSDHDHFTDVWSGSSGAAGLSITNSATAYAVKGLYVRASAETGLTYGVYGRCDSDAGYGVYGSATAATGETYGVCGKTGSNSGRGVYGHAYADSGAPSGVYGESNSPAGIGVCGTSPARGVYGQAYADSGVTCGVYGLSASPDGRGVYGFGASCGVLGESAVNGGRGVIGKATAPSGVTIGVRGQSDSTSGRGVYGYTSAESGTTYAIMGYCWSAAGYDFYASGGGTNYGPFTGGHEVRLDLHFPADPKPGLIVSATGKTERRTAPDGTVSLSSTLPTVTLACKANDKAVFGVLVAENTLPEDHWYKARDGERFGVANALGEGRVWVCDVNGAIEAGDYITTSAVPGYGQKQHDDLLHNYTLGKATETIDWDAVTETIEISGRKIKVYLLAVVYTSG